MVIRGDGEISKLETAIARALVEDATVGFSENEVITAHRDEQEMMTAMSSGGIMVSHSDGRRGSKLIHGKPLTVDLRFVVSIGRAWSDSSGVIVDDVLRIIQSLQSKKIEGASLSYEFHSFGKVKNGVVWYDVVFLANGIILKDHE